MKTVLGLGGNLGNREENLAMAVEELEKLPRTRLLAMSNLYETAPFDVASEQPDYLNCCVLAETRLSPEELLEQCLAIEDRLGRVRTEYHGARTVDIDLLLFEGCRKDTELERAFVLAPLSDLFPGHIAPPFQFDFSEAYQAVDKTGVRLYK